MLTPILTPYISTGLKENKFGVPIEDAIELYKIAFASESLRPVGIACHIGSQLTDSSPVIEAIGEVVHLAEELKKLVSPLRILMWGEVWESSMMMRVRRLSSSGCPISSPVFLDPIESR